MSTSITRGKRVVAAIAVAALTATIGALGALPAQAADTPPAIEQRTPQTVVTADALPTVQLDSGIVWSQDTIGDIVYAGGSFSNTRPAGAAQGQSLTPRSNLLAYNVRTGQLVNSWAPTVNGVVKVVKASPDGKRIYVGGTFNNASGSTRWNLAAFDATTGALISGFNAAVGGAYVNALAVTNSTVYVGGLISAGNGVARKNLMAFNSSGQLLGWAPTTDLQVDSMVMAPKSSNVVVAGRFSTVNEVTQRGLAALDPVSGAIMPWTAPSVVINGMGAGGNKGKAGIWSITADSEAVYGTGWVYADVATGNLEGTFAADGATGDIRWIADCHGDHYGVFSDGTTVYTTSHEHSCDSMGGYPQKDPSPGNMRNATAVTAAAKGTLARAGVVNNIYKDWSGWPSAAAINWYPDWYTGTASGQGQAGWSITGNKDFISVGGEFPGVNGQGQYGLVRFAKVPATGAKQGPRLSGDAWALTGLSARGGAVRLSIPANWDRDDLNLKYEVTRIGRAEPVAVLDQKSSFWRLPTMTFTDTGLTPGSTVSYRVKAIDGDGNSATSKTISVQVSDKVLSKYADAVIDDGAGLFYPLGSGSSTTPDLAGTIDGVVGTGVSFTGTSAIVGDTDKSATFDGTSNGLVRTSVQVPTTPSFSTELWFRTDTTQGGKLAGYGNSPTDSSGNYDRHIYMTNGGNVVFGTYPGYTATITSPNAYNNNAWHHVVATQDASGMKLFIDGSLIGTDGASTAQSYGGYWRIGGDNLNGWPNQPSSQWFKGSIDEFAVYTDALTAGQVRAHHDLGTGAFPPKAAFDATVADLSVSFDASGTVVSEGRTIQSYSWDFGDGSDPSADPTPVHEYDEAGEYTVKLTVTDNTGATGTISKNVTPKAAHVAPVAVIKNVATSLSVAFDGTDSQTSDGATISSYEWNFGDDSTSTNSKPTHKYAQSGTYDVSLKVTDSQGAASQVVTKQVTVEHADPVAAFTVSATDLKVAVDASTSTASDDATLSYKWSWGDSTGTDTGRTATHTYGSAGTYDIELTVTDSLGGTKKLTKSVAVSDVTYVARDTFNRTVASGWGTADVGGAWSGTTSYSVSNGAGQIAVDKTQTRNISLPVSAAHSDSRFTVTLDKVPDANVHMNYVVHKSSAGDLRVKLRYLNGTVNVGLAKMVGTTETLLTNKNLPGYTQSAGSKLNVRLQVIQNGTSTTLQSKVWPAGTDEPGTWTVTASNADSALQGAGQIGFSTYGAGTLTNGPVKVSIDDLTVR